MSDAVTALLVVFAGVMGLVVGSFLNVVVHRVPRHESVVRPRSRCPECGIQLASRDNVPVVSWLLLRGRCRTCGTPIPARYPLVEVGAGLLFAAVALRFADDGVAALPAFLVLAAACIAISAVDLEHFIVPNRIVYPTLFLLAPLLVAAAAVEDDWASLRGAVLGGLLGFVILFVVHFVSPRGMGFGDVRLSGLLGVGLGWLDLGHVFLGLFLGFLTASVISLALIGTKRRSRKDKIPFGPFLALGAFLAVLFGEPILRWYAV